MNHRHFCFFLLLLPAFSLFGQGPWTQKATFPGFARHRPFTFSIGNRGYVGCGWNGVTMYQDFYEYDPGSDTWTQKANYPAGPRLSAFGFSIGNKGYAGTGLDQNLIAQGDFYEYDPAANVWTAKAPFIGAPVFGSTAVVVDGYAYVLFGDEWDPTYYRHNELYKYDPYLNIWSYVNNFPADGRRDAVGFAIGSKMYVGTGNDNSYIEDGDWWEFDPSGNTWTQKALFAGSARSQAIGFAVGGAGYVGTGGLADVNDIWQYDATADTWKQVDDFPGQGRENSSTFVIGSKGYLACGTSGTNYADVWEFNPLNITGVNEEEQPFSFSVYPNPVTTTATIGLNSEGNYTMELFDANGKLVLEKKFSGTRVSVDCSGLADGNYSCRIYCDGRLLGLQKIIVR